MIGNDIVDLNLAKLECNWQRKGFLEKQFTTTEIDKILTSENPLLKICLFWSMKEAAYKNYTQKINKRFFAPKKFDCSLVSEESGIVIFENQSFNTTTLISSSYLHTIVKDDLDNNYSEFPFFTSTGNSNTVDIDLKKQLQKETGIPFLKIEKRNSNIGIPSFYYQDKLLTQFCSISHHGNFGAYAFILKK